MILLQCNYCSVLHSLSQCIAKSNAIQKDPTSVPRANHFVGFPLRPLNVDLLDLSESASAPEMWGPYSPLRFVDLCHILSYLVISFHILSYLVISILRRSIHILLTHGPLYRQFFCSLPWVVHIKLGLLQFSDVLEELEACSIRISGGREWNISQHQRKTILYIYIPMYL